MSRLDPQSLTRHVDRLYRAAWALCGSSHDAEDLVQETFARVLARPRFLRGQDELAYLMQVLRNTFLTQRRTAARRPLTSAATLEDLEPADPRSAGRPEEAFAAQEVFEAIAGLPETYRLALVAVDVVGLSYREAASALGTREATIATRVFRARRQAARKLTDQPSAEPTPRLPSTDPAPSTDRVPSTDRALSTDPAPAAKREAKSLREEGQSVREGQGPQESLV
jgi:RNA polymerase sigma-70 factor (ECF subfamily)